MTAQLPEWVRETISGLPTLVTIDEAADLLRCSRRSVGRLLADGRLKGVKAQPGAQSRVLIPRAQFGAYLAALGAS